MSFGVQTAPLLISSGDLIADRRYQWALDYLARGDRGGAAEILAQGLETAPAFAGACNAEPQDYHGAPLRLARLGVGEATPAMMQVHVRRLFDQHAPRFDQSLLQHLDYRGPQLLLEAVSRSAGLRARFASMLDLG